MKFTKFVAHETKELYSRYTHVQISCSFVRIIEFKIRSFMAFYHYLQPVVVDIIVSTCTNHQLATASEEVQFMFSNHTQLK